MDRREQVNSDEQVASAAERVWRFATLHYARDAVARACLRAQDELGMDVILVLYAAWRGSEGQALDVRSLAAAEAACRRWRDAVVLPLRARRREWKRSEVSAFEYAAIKQLELQAERAQLEMLAGGCPAATAAAGSEALLAANLRALCEHYGVAEEALAELLAALLPA